MSSPVSSLSFIPQIQPQLCLLISVLPGFKLNINGNIIYYFCFWIFPKHIICQICLWYWWKKFRQPNFIHSLWLAVIASKANFCIPQGFGSQNISYCAWKPGMPCSRYQGCMGLHVQVPAFTPGWVTLGSICHADPEEIPVDLILLNMVTGSQMYL